MRVALSFSLSVLALLVTGCAATADFARTGNAYPRYEGPVEIYYEVPEDVEYKRVGIVSSKGGQVHSRADMLKAMQEEAAENGANAIIVVSEENKEKLFGSANQYGAYVTTITSKSASAVAIRVGDNSGGLKSGTKNNVNTGSSFEKPWDETFSGGASVNGLSFVLGGSGFNLWLGKKKVRVVGGYYSVDTPGALLSGGFVNGRAESAYSLEGDYFFLENLSGPYFSTGFEYLKNSVGHEDTLERGSWEDFLFSVGTGYVVRLNRFVYLDGRISLNASLSGDRTIDVGGREFVPDSAVPSAFLGVGVNF